MKKHFFSIFAFLTITTPLFAAPEDNNGDDLSDSGSVTTYWGTEASTNPNNPCKGATIRKCAEIVVNMAPGKGVTYMTTTIKDGKGNTKAVYHNVVAASPEEIITEHASSLPYNAQITEIKL